MYHYLEGPTGPNPWDDDYSRANRPKVPAMRCLSDAEQSQEDVDTPEELEWGRRMTAQRNLFLQRLVASVENERKPKNPALPHFVSGSCATYLDSGNYR
jgi:Ino eighty subunit 1